jgi:hypothetical protein
VILYVKEILSQHIVLRQEAVTAVDKISKLVSSTLVMELRISVRYFEAILGRHPLLTPHFSALCLYLGLLGVVRVSIKVIITH